jgi:hypothetical protein
LERFGDAEVASLIAPDALIIEAARGPELVVPTGTGGGPGRLLTPPIEAVRAEIERAKQLVSGLKTNKIELVVSGDGTTAWVPGSPERVLQALSSGGTMKTSSSHLPKLEVMDPAAPAGSNARDQRSHAKAPR